MPSFIESLSGEAVPCILAQECRNSPESAGIVLSRCRDCRLACQFGGTGLWWRPKDKKKRHPVLEAEKRQKALNRKLSRLAERKAKDQKRQKINATAERAEKRTQKNLSKAGTRIRATKNSGRSHRDGDHLVNTHPDGSEQLHPEYRLCTLDTKLQSRADNPRVLLVELDKVRADASRAGTAVGALILRNKHDRGVAVFAEEDLTAFFEMFSKVQAHVQAE
jgi:hypothetical protein